MIWSILLLMSFIAGIIVGGIIGASLGEDTCAGCVALEYFEHKGDINHDKT